MSWLSLLLVLLRVRAALQDLLSTFRGYRPANDLSFSPTWPKAARDFYTVGISLAICDKARARALAVRGTAAAIAAFYAVLAINQVTDAMVALRGVVWAFTLAWTWTWTWT